MLLQRIQNYKPRTSYGDGGVVTLTRWFEKTKSIFEIYACLDEFKVKYVAYTYADSALSWWNGHDKTFTLAVANAMRWEDLNVMMLEEYCLRSEMQKLEQELWEHAMKGSNIAIYVV